MPNNVIYLLMYRCIYLFIYFPFRKLRLSYTAYTKHTVFRPLWLPVIIFAFNRCCRVHDLDTESVQYGPKAATEVDAHEQLEQHRTM